MSKRLLPTLFALCFLSASFISCKKNISEDNNPVTPPGEFAIPAATPVNGSVSGRIIDENNAPVPSATVECAGITTFTNADGFFDFNNVTLDKYISTVKVTKTGYFKGYRSFCANASRNLVTIKLIPRTLSGTISSASAGSITLANSTQISFQANSMVIKSSGSAYTGTVNVYASYIDPTSSNIGVTVPGSFMGEDDTNLYSLQSAGMIAVEMESASGEALQLATGLPASIKLAIPTSILNKVPATIDTWSLDERGIWKKENTATKSGNYYEMQVTHFSFWNCDQPMNAIYLSIHLQDGNGINIPNAIIKLTAASNTAFFGVRSGQTDVDGNVSGMVPSGFGLAMEIWSAATGDCIIPTTLPNIGPFNADASITVTAILTSSQILTVSGTVNECSGQPLANGTALIFAGPQYTYAHVSNGMYSTVIIHCDPITSVAITVRDNADLTALVNAGSYTVNTDTITVPLLILSCPIPLNIYDGIYQVTGSYYDTTNALFLGNYPTIYHLVTIGPTSVNVEEQINGEFIPGYLFFSGATSSFYGNFGLQAFFNPAINTVSEVRNYYGDPINALSAVGDPSLGSGAPFYQGAAPRLRTAGLDPTGLNSYDPITRTIRIKYFMYQADVPMYPEPRCYMDETWTYIGPR